MNFQVGQRVRCVTFCWDDALEFGETGTIRCVLGNSNPPIGVEWDEFNPERHRLGYGGSCTCEQGHGWYVYPGEIESITVTTIGLEELI